MKKLFPVTTPVTILNGNEETSIIFMPLSEKECNKLKDEISYLNTYLKSSKKRAELNSEFKSLFKFTLEDIIAIGDNKIETRLANTLIEHHTIKIQDIVKKNFKCFVNSDWKTIGTMNLPYHEDGGCSWNCLMEKLRHPEFGVIFKIDTSELNFYKIN